MDVKNGIIIDGVLHELKASKRKFGCEKCSLYKLRNEDFGMACICWINLESEEVNQIDNPPMFVNRGKVKITKEE